MRITIQGRYSDLVSPNMSDIEKNDWGHVFLCFIVKLKVNGNQINCTPSIAYFILFFWGNSIWATM